MEPNACLAVPRGDDLIIYVSAQIVDAARTSIASTLRMDPQRIQVIAPYVGGGFGSKLGIHSETILAAIAARLLKKPVKVVLARQQIFHLMGVRPTTSQRVRLGAGAGRPPGGDRPRSQHVYQPARGVRRTDGRHDARAFTPLPTG